jgi:outer membrane usher protein
MLNRALRVLLVFCLTFGKLHAAGLQTTLLLDVVINGAPMNLICSFTQFPDGSIGTTESELASMGLHTDAVPSEAGIVMLHDIPTLKYSYEERSQRIQITVDDRYRNAQTIDLRNGVGTPAGRAQAGFGAVLNYDLFGGYGEEKETRTMTYATYSATLEGRVFSPFGTLSQTGIARMGAAGVSPLVRLDTSFRYSDPGKLITLNAGDEITGSLWWSRPIRIGGLQGQTNFALRPDLVTLALPNLGGTAAVPSSIDVYVNNIHTYSQDIGTGPFNLTNIPMLTGAGNAQVVVRDASGHTTTTSIPFYGSTLLLAPGRGSWSVEAGLPRLSYGSIDDHYDGTPVGSGTWRRGLLRWLTVEAHAEGGAGIGSGGGGAAVRIGSIGIANIDGAGSAGNGRPGGQADATFETTLFGVNISFATQRAFGNYQDLASATAQRQAQAAAANIGLLGSYLITTPKLTLAQSQLIYTSAQVPRAIDRATFGGKMPFDKKAGWSISLVHQHDAGGAVSSIVSLSYSRALPWHASAFATAYRDFGSDRSIGALFGLSIPLGPKTSVSANFSGASGGMTESIAASRSIGNEPGSYGWQVGDTEGATQYRTALGSYRATVATVQAGVNQSKSSLGGTVEVTGAVAAMAGDIFFSNRITDAFAVVDAGMPGVAVAYENRPVGTTDSQGELLVPGLRSYQKNRISIDPTNLPVDAELATTRQIVTPADRAGVVVSMKPRTNRMAAVVTFVRPDGAAVPAGASGRREGGHDFIVGYDGQSFIKDLAPINHVTIESDGSTCHVTFPFQPHPGTQVKIGPLTCR